MITNREALELLKNKKIESLIDNTILRQDASEKDIEDFILESMKYNFFSICLNPCWLKFAKSIVKDSIKLATVIGFPLGANSSQTKIYETENAIIDGADEIDMVINVGHLKSKKYKEIEDEIKNIKKVCNNLILKVIIETCLLTKDEIVDITKIIESAGADFVKTSTGFSKDGAQEEDVLLISKTLSKNIGIKASGGIRDIEKFSKMIHAGATRVGVSCGVKLVNEIRQIL